MRPGLKIGNIKDLHDARYCAAIGISLLSFNLSSQLEDFIEAKALKEISEWLSGPELIGRFLYESPDEINRIAVEAGIQRVSLPMDYQSSFAAKLDFPILFRQMESKPFARYDLLNLISQEFPNSLFEYLPQEPFPTNNSDLKMLLNKSILFFADSEGLFTFLSKNDSQPFAFSLGSFTMEEDGQIDYDLCDQFIEAFETFEIA